MNSNDAVASVAAICKRAIAIGLRGITLTDHINVYYGAERNREVVENVKEDVASVRKEFGSRLEISLGIELGEGHHDLPFFRELISDGEIDFVIGSLHQPRNSLDYYEIDFDRSDVGAILDLYYEEMMEMASGGCYDVIGHFNLPLRYMSAALRAHTNLSPYLDRMRGILREVARAGKGIEINTSGLWRGQGFTLPTVDLVSVFREEGGEIVTIGSDAHRAEHVGLAIDGGMKCLAEAGFEKFAFFKKRVPHFYGL